MKYPKVVNAKAIDKRTLLVEFDNAEKRHYDISPLLEKEAFSPLKNFALFKAVKIDVGGYAVVWNENIDLSEYELWTHGTPITN